jgi:hypothetical protein
VTRTHLKDLVVAVSLANLLFLKAWIEIFEGVRHPYFRADASLYWIDCAAAMLVVLLTGGVFWLGASLARRSGKPAAMRLARLVFLVVFVWMLFIVLNVMRRRFPALSPDALQESLGQPLLIVLLLGILALLVRGRRHLVGAAAVVVLIFSPFAAITFGQAIWLGLRQSSWLERTNGAGPAATPHPARPASRVLWFIFDDMDYRLSFPDRPAAIALPEFDRLRGETLFATHAIPPAAYTGRSLPALITGRRIVQATPVGADELRVLFEGSTQPIGWSTQPNVFSRAHGAGYTTGIVGWYHPYCRLFRTSLTSCFWEPFNAARADYPISKSMLEFIRMTAPPFLRSLFDRVGIRDPDWNTQYHISSYLRLLDHARDVVVNPDLDLVLVHLPVPHPPFIYDRRQRTYTFAADPQEGYLDNLVLADKTLGEIRARLEAAGLWNSAAILVSSDHPWRDSDKFDGQRDPRVPFLLKLPGQTQGVSYERTFGTVLTGDLLLALLRGELKTPESAAQWLDQRGRVAPGPE